MKRFAIFFSLILMAAFFAKVAYAAEVEEPVSSLSSVELLLELGILVFVGGIIYNLWGTINSYGGLIGKALKLVGVGVILFSFEAVDKTLEHFGLDFIENMLSHSGEEIFHDLLKILGLFFLAWGLSRFAKIAGEAKS